MKNNCGCSHNSGASAKPINPVIEQDDPLVFEIQSKPNGTIDKNTKPPLVVDKASMQRTATVDQAIEPYEKITIIDDAELQPREKEASGWFWGGLVLMVGGIIWKAS